MSNSLRREFLVRDMPNVRHVEDWGRLLDLFEELETAGRAQLEEKFRLVLWSLARRLASQKFHYTIPHISLDRLGEIMENFLAPSSGGLRPLAVTTALLRTVNRALFLFSRVESQGINEADAAGGMPGDIRCYSRDDETRVCLVVEVKDLDITLSQVKTASRKAKQNDRGVSNLVFAVPAVRASDHEQVAGFTAHEWASGMNIYVVSIRELVKVLFIFLDEKWRVQLLREIGDELDARQDQLARKDWNTLLLTAENL